MRYKRKQIDLSQLPAGSASNKFTSGCLVLEGGAFRGLYTQGVLDYFMENDLNFDCVIGVSAGALGGLNYVSGQIGRSARINLGYRYDSRYIGAKALAESKSIIRLDFLFQEGNKIEPFAEKRFYNSPQRFVVVATNCDTGEAEFFEKGRCKDMKEAIKASATMPYISPVVMVEGKPCLDGGCSCKIPYQWAIDQGYEKIVVIQTRERGFRKPEKEEGFLNRMTSRLYREYPALVEALDYSNIKYNQTLSEIETLHDKGEILALTPSQPVNVSRLERSLGKLKDLYDLGYWDARNNFLEIESYLSS